jgi:hypothetical protein
VSQEPGQNALQQGRSMVVAVVAEKPTVGRDLAQVLGATRRGVGTLSGNGYVVSRLPLSPLVESVYR